MTIKKIKNKNQNNHIILAKKHVLLVVTKVICIGIAHKKMKIKIILTKIKEIIIIAMMKVISLHNIHREEEVTINVEVEEVEEEEKLVLLVVNMDI